MERTSIRPDKEIQGSVVNTNMRTDLVSPREKKQNNDPDFKNPTQVML